MDGLRLEACLVVEILDLPLRNGILFEFPDLLSLFVIWEMEVFCGTHFANFMVWVVALGRAFLLDYPWSSVMMQSRHDGVEKRARRCCGD